MASTDILRVLGKEYAAEILEAAHEPRSAQELSANRDIPIATCYRRVDELTEAGLLERVDRQTSEGQPRVNLYRRLVDELLVRFDRSSCRVVVEGRSPVKETLDGARRLTTPEE